MVAASSVAVSLILSRISLPVLKISLRFALTASMTRQCLSTSTIIGCMICCLDEPLALLSRPIYRVITSFFSNLTETDGDFEVSNPVQCVQK
jgi:hypothetical protein